LTNQSASSPAAGRFPTEEDIYCLMTALEDDPNGSNAILIILLITASGCTPSMLKALRWTEVDFRTGQLVLPKGAVPIDDRLRDLLLRRRSRHPNGKFVVGAFPARVLARARQLITRTCRSLGLPVITLEELRGVFQRRQSDVRLGQQVRLLKKDPRFRAA